MQISDPLLGAMIAASASFISAIVQLYINARRQQAERKAGKPVTRKSGNWLAILGLILGAAVGGYFLAEYKSAKQRDGDIAMRQEMTSQLRNIGEAATRIEQAGLQKNAQNDAEARLIADRRRGMDGVAAVIGLAPCAIAQTASATAAPPACSEANALKVSLCAVIPANANLGEVQLFTRLDDAAKTWSESKVQLGQDAGGARFVDAPFERTQADGKEICQNFMHWDSQKARQARIVVKFAL